MVFELLCRIEYDCLLSCLVMLSIRRLPIVKRYTLTVGKRLPDCTRSNPKDCLHSRRSEDLKYHYIER